MARCEVQWASDAYGQFEDAAEQNIGTLTEALVLHLGLLKTDPQGNPIHYGLFIKRSDQYHALNPQEKLGSFVGELLFLANPRQPWWRFQAPKEPEIRPPDLPELFRPSRCQITVVPGYSITVPPEGFVLSREAIYQRLPVMMRMRANLGRFLGLKLRLQCVSRETHCFFQQGIHNWELVAYYPVLLGQQRYEHGAILSLDGELTVRLGVDGWPIQVSITTLERTPSR